MDGGRWAQNEATFPSLSQPLRSLSAKANNRQWLYLRGNKEEDAVGREEKGGGGGDRGPELNPPTRFLLSRERN